MLKKQKLQFLIFFMAGFIAAGLLAWSVIKIQKAEAADQYACIRQDLDAKAMSGNIPDPAFSIFYDIPKCYVDAGYRPARVYLYNGMVAVRYEKQ